MLWDWYLYSESIHCAHSRGILILPVGPLPISRIHSLCPLKRHFDTCRGTSTYIANPFIVPTQEEFWYLPWDYYLYRESIHYAHSRGILELLLILSLAHSTSHSRGILILAVELLLALSLAHSTPHSRGNTGSCVDALSIFTLVVTVNHSCHKPTRVHSRDNSVNCR